MAEILLPSSDEGQSRFNCPKCNWPHWFTNRQLEKRRIIVTCDCGKTFAPRLTLDEKKPSKSSRVNLLTNRNIQIAIAVLQTRKSEADAIKAVTSVFSESKTLEQLIQDSLDYGN